MSKQLDVCLAAAMTVCLAGWALAADSASKPATEPAPTACEATLPIALPPALRDRVLGERPGWSAEVDRQRQELASRLTAARRPRDRASAHLAMANWLLAVPTAPAATRWLIGVESPDDRALLSRCADAAREHLVQARLLIDTGIQTAPVDTRPGSSSSAPSTEPPEALRAAFAYLDAFADLFAAAESPEHDRSSRSAAWGRVARGLSVTRESAEEEVAACALMWQVLAWHFAGRSDRARASLPEALRPPRHPEYDFLTRLLRCRMLADEEQYAAACALAIRIRQACRAWFAQEDEPVIASRRRLAALLQYVLTARWRARLRAEQSSPDGPTLESILTSAERLLLAESDSESARAFVLRRSVPLLIEPPRPASPDDTADAAPLASTQPATQPADSRPANEPPAEPPTE